MLNDTTTPKSFDLAVRQLHGPERSGTMSLPNGCPPACAGPASRSVGWPTTYMRIKLERHQARLTDYRPFWRKLPPGL